LQVWSFKAGFAFPEEGNLGGIVPRRREIGVFRPAATGFL
jgi:hypothetical protein